MTKNPAKRAGGDDRASGDDHADGQPDPNGAAAPLPTTYEQARDELGAVVAALEEGGLTLDESLTLWERGQALAAACETFLAGARARVEAVLAEPGPGAGQPGQD